VLSGFFLAVVGRYVLPCGSIWEGATVWWVGGFSGLSPEARWTPLLWGASGAWAGGLKTASRFFRFPATRRIPSMCARRNGCSSSRFCSTSYPVV